MTEATNKIAVVTGAGTGVGRAASLALMAAGFTVVLAGRRIEMLEETKKLGEKAGKSLAVSADMADPGSIAALFAKVMDVYGRLDLLFNNAGMGATGPALRTPTEAFARVICPRPRRGWLRCTCAARRRRASVNPATLRGSRRRRVRGRARR